MKKLFIVAAMALATLTACAQEEVGSWSIAPKLGLGYTTFNGDNDSEIDGGITGTVGCEFGYQAAEQFNVTAGVDFRYIQSDEYNYAHLEYGFVDLSVLAHYNFTKNFGVFAGPKVSFMTNADSKYDHDGTSISKSVKDDHNTTLFSVPVGVQVNFNRPFVLSLYYDIPCTKVNKNGSESATMAGIMASLAYRFSL